MFPMEKEEMDYAKKIRGRQLRLLFFGRPREDGKYVHRGVEILWMEESGSEARIELLIVQDEFPATEETYNVTLSVSTEVDRMIEMGTVEETFRVERVEDGKTAPALLCKKMDDHLERIIEAIDLYVLSKDLIVDEEVGKNRMWVRTLSEEERLRYEIEDLLERYDFDTYYNVIKKILEDLEADIEELEAERAVLDEDR